MGITLRHNIIRGNISIGTPPVPAGLLSPAQIFGANYYDDWDAADLALTNGDPVSSWVSKGLNGATMVAGSGNEPTYNTSTYTFPTVESNGTTDFMQVLSSVSMYNFLKNEQGFVCFIARKKSDSNGGLLSNVNLLIFSQRRGIYYGAAVSSSGVGQRYRQIIGADNNLFFVNNIPSGTYTTTDLDCIYMTNDCNNPIDADRGIININFGADEKNNTLSIRTSTSDAVGNLTLFKDLGSLYGDWYLARLIISDTIPTTQQLTDLQTYLTTTYGTFPI